MEQVETDGDGTLETTLYPVTDLLGSVHLLTDDTGAPVERITYDPHGTPHFWSADTERPGVTRVAWTGDGADLRCGAGMPPQPCPAAALEVGFDEPVDPASVADATATLTPQGGDPIPLTLDLTPDGRAAYLTGATVAAGAEYTLHLEGLRDRAGNPLWPSDVSFTVSDPQAYEVLDDTAPPSLLAVLDTQDGLYLVLDEPVEPAAGFDWSNALTITRQGQPVAGTITPISPQILRWQPAEEGAWLAGGAYTLAALHLQDLAGSAITAPSPTFTHLAASPDLAYLAYEARSDSQPRATSAYGLTTTFQGRTWHPDLGAYHYRARWYLPAVGVFTEQDPMGYSSWAALYQALGGDHANARDPFGFQDEKARNINGIPIPESWFHLKPARVYVDGKSYLVSLSGTVMDEATGRILPDFDERARRAREATGWQFSNPGLARLVEHLEEDTRVFQNRWTVGLVVDALYGVAVGLHYGLNLQVWLDRHNLPVAGVYWLEAITPAAKAQGFWETVRKLPVGFGVAGGLSGDVAHFRDHLRPERTFDDMEPSDITETWAGPFEAVSLGAAVSGSLFWNEDYIGVSVGGGGLALFHDVTNYHRLSTLSGRGLIGQLRLALSRVPLARLRRSAERWFEEFLLLSQRYSAAGTCAP